MGDYGALSMFTAGSMPRSLKGESSANKSRDGESRVKLFIYSWVEKYGNIVDEITQQMDFVNWVAIVCVAAPSRETADRWILDHSQNDKAFRELANLLQGKSRPAFGELEVSEYELGTGLAVIFQGNFVGVEIKK